MDYKIVEKEAFTVMGAARNFHYERAFAEIPQFWTEFCQGGSCKAVCGMYGVCIENGKNSKEFEYLIADNYIPCLLYTSAFSCLRCVCPDARMRRCPSPA